jgi:hypothetical protein
MSRRRSSRATRPTPDRLRGSRRRRSRAGSSMRSAAWTKIKSRKSHIWAASLLATTFGRLRTRTRRPTIMNAFAPASSASRWRVLRSASWASTNGKPVCPHCGGLEAYEAQRPNVFVARSPRLISRSPRGRSLLSINSYSRFIPRPSRSFVTRSKVSRL